MIRCYNPVAVKMPQKIYFSWFLGTKILESQAYVFNSKSAAPEPILLKFGQLIVKEFFSKPCRRFLFSFSVFELSSFFQRKCWWFAPSDFILLSRKNKCTCQKSETRFFSRTCQEANAMFTVLFRLFLEGLELNLHRHMLWQKPSQLRSLLRIWDF